MRPCHMYDDFDIKRVTGRKPAPARDVERSMQLNVFTRETILGAHTSASRLILWPVYAAQSTA